MSRQDSAAGPEPAATTAQIVRAGDRERFVSSGVEHLFAFSAAQTGGALSVETFLVSSGRVGAPPHTYRSHDERFVVLAGELTVVACRRTCAAGR